MIEVISEFRSRGQQELQQDSAGSTGGKVDSRPPQRISCEYVSTCAEECVPARIPPVEGCEVEGRTQHSITGIGVEAMHEEQLQRTCAPLHCRHMHGTAFVLVDCELQGWISLFLEVQSQFVDVPFSRIEEQRSMGISILTGHPMDIEFGLTEPLQPLNLVLRDPILPSH